MYQLTHAHGIASIIFGMSETIGPMLDCSDCHTPETSGEYAGNEQLYLEKIIHWKSVGSLTAEQNPPANVK
jgi:hypothetical protein